MSGTTGGDFAGLVITNEDPPAGAGTARISEDPDRGRGPVEVYGIPTRPARPEGVWAPAIVRGVVGGGMLQLTADSASTLIQPGFSGSPLVQTDAADGHDWVVGMLVATGRTRRDGQALPASRLLDAWPDMVGIPPSPYRGLLPFSADDAGTFTGRQREVRELRRLVDGGPLTVVVGTSGIGKSSLVEAGLVSAWRAEGGLAVTLRASSPGQGEERLENLLADLAAALRDDLGDLTIDQLRPGAPASVGRRAAACGRRVLIHLDQFEQLLDAVPAARHAQLVETLFPPSGSKDDACRVVVSLRADFLQSLLALPDQGRRLQDRLLTVSPMGAEELRQAVTEPAERHQVRFEQGLPEQIAADASSPTGSLPLLQFSLQRLWGQQRNRQLRFADYRAIGGVQSALQDYADQAFDSLGEEDRRRAEQVLLAVVRTRGGATQAIVHAVPLAQLDEARPVIEQLSVNRLLLVEGVGSEPVVRLTHEALIRDWPRLRALVDADPGFQQWLVATEDRLARNELIPEAQLLTAEEYVAAKGSGLPPEVRKVVVDSRADVDRRRRVRRLVRLGIAALVAVAVVLSVVVVRANNSLGTARDTANAQALGQLAQDRLPTDVASATQLALAAARADPDQIDARNALAGAFVARRSTTAVTTALDGANVTALATAPQGDLTVLHTPTGLQIADGLSGGTVTLHPVPGTGSSTNVLVAGGGRWLVLQDPGGPWRVLERPSSGPPRPLDIAGNAAVTVSPDGVRLVVTTPGPNGDQVRLEDLATGASTPLAVLPDPGITSVWQTADPRRLLVRAGPTALTVRDAASGAVVSTPPPDARVAADGASTVRCVASGYSSALQVSDAATGTLTLQTGGAASDSPCSDHVIITEDRRHAAWILESSTTADIVEVADLTTDHRTTIWTSAAAGLNPSSPQSIRHDPLLGDPIADTALSSLTVHGDRALLVDHGQVDTLALSPSPSWRNPPGDRGGLPFSVSGGATGVLVHGDGSAESVRTSDGSHIAALAVSDLGLLPGETARDEGGDSDGQRYFVITTSARGVRVHDYAVPSFRPLGVFDLVAVGAAGVPGLDPDGLVDVVGDRVAILAGGVLSWWSASTHELIAPPVVLARDPAAAAALAAENQPGQAMDGAGESTALRQPASLGPDGQPQEAGIVIWHLGSDRPTRIPATLVGRGKSIEFAGRTLVTLEQPGSIVQRDVATGAVLAPPVPIAPAPGTLGILGVDSTGDLVTDDDSKTATADFWDLHADRPDGHITFPGFSPGGLANDRLDNDSFTDFESVPIDPRVWRSRLCAAQNRPFSSSELAVLPQGTDTDPPCG